MAISTGIDVTIEKHPAFHSLSVVEICEKAHAQGYTIVAVVPNMDINIHGQFEVNLPEKPLYYVFIKVSR